MSARDQIHTIPDSKPVLVSAHITDRIHALQNIAQQLPEGIERQQLLSTLVALAQEHQVLVVTVSQGMDMLHQVNNGLSAAVKLLDCCEDQRLNGHELASLIAPHQRNLLRGIEHAGQIL